MANICRNYVQISGKKEEVKKFKDFLRLDGEDFNFNTIIPIVKYSQEEAIKKWGCSSIGFNVKMKYEGKDKEQLNLTFWTKWNPPYLIYKKLKEQFPIVFIYWRYEEPGQDLYGFLNKNEF